MRMPAVFLLAALALAPQAGAVSGDIRTLVVRGRVLAAEGTPVAGARVSTRGSESMAAVTDDRGRYALSVPIGSVAALRRGAFRLEVRAEAGGRRLAFAAGGPALAIEVALAPGGDRLRVRSNSPEAATAIATAFAEDGVTTAWADADFGGSSRPGGSTDMRYDGEVMLDGSRPPAVRETARTAEPMRAPARTREPAAVAPPPGARIAPAESLPARVPSPAPARVAPPAPRPSRASLAMRRDSIRLAKAARARARRDSAAATGRAAGAPPPPPVVAVVAPAGHAAALVPRAAPGTAAVAESSETCACRVRGTVEIDWDRPLERDFPVDLSLEGPARQDAAVQMFMGSPREFRFGPLPCGEYRLVVRAHGRFRYALERGDSVLVLPCRGLTQVRVVLAPARR